MTSLITGTWTLVSSSVEIIKSTRRMTLRIHRLLQPGLSELSEGDQRRLLGLQKRVECLVQPLNFLLLWSKQRDSCVQQVVLSAQELLFDVCSFVERFVPPDGSPAPPGPGGATIDSDQLEYYVRELEFACASVGMAVSIAKATEAPQPCPAQTHEPRDRGGAAGGSVGSSGVSLSALLRASRRIQEMHGRSGDLCTCPGRLYVQAVAGSGAATGSRGDAASGCGASSNGMGDVQGRRGVGEWQPVLSLATFKVVAVADSRLRRRRYRISVESRLPLSQPGTGHREAQPPCYDGVRDDESAAPAGGLNTSGPLDFPIEAALDANLVTTGHVGLPTEPAHCALDLAVDSLALLWGGGGPPPSAGTTSGSGSAGADELGGDLLTDAVLLPEAVTAAEAVPRPLWPASRRLRSASPTVHASTALCSRYAFIFDCQRGEAEMRSGEAEVALTPLDAMYLARLCALDDGHHQPFLPQDGSGAEAAAACPPHLLSSDEVLSALLFQQDLECGDTAANVAAPGGSGVSAAAVRSGG
mmetsp:Transcript_81409/g.225460  ORF Transcript_81409/g.225460 Transcript_81409/m.225460 type:complete len:529 (-) Transcript_81409:75-1661(-)